uniref:Reverse transcriptase RNase H-like domain-containing protein n=1 Tax=Bionectria ochroleuca TaxID=29856 RepID=A0A8H7K3B5_BIOOC
MDELKDRLTKAPILTTIDYAEGHGEIILQVDASPTGWGYVLMQVVDGERKPARFESGSWTKTERNYDQTKRECRAVLCAFRRLRNWLYGTRFTLETDAQVLVHQLNGKAEDVPGAMIIRWLSYLFLIDFEVRHIKGVNNAVADGLSRKESRPSDRVDGAFEGDIEDDIDNALNAIFVNVNKITEAEYTALKNEPLDPTLYGPE